MNIRIGFNFVSPEISTKKQALGLINKVLNGLISSVVYGKSLETVLIGLIAVEPIYNKFAKPRRPRYTEHKETMAFGSIPIIIHKTLEIEIKLDYEQVLTADDEALCKIVAIDVLNTLRTLKLPKKVTDFDKDKFVTDVEEVFITEHLIE
jgi:hypothetical protein